MSALGDATARRRDPDGEAPAGARERRDRRPRRARPGAAAVWEAVERESAALEGRGRVLVRPSGTEPLVRVMVEAPTQRGVRRGLRPPRHELITAKQLSLAPGRRSTLTRLQCAESLDMSGRRPCRDLLVAGLEKLEYRGYDSAGISLLEDGRIDSVRAVGNLSNLRAAVGLDGAPVSTATGRRRRAPAGDDRPRAHPLGHPRPGDRGERPSARRLHGRDPHRPQRHRREPRRAAPSELEAEGHRFSSETDAEIVAHLIERSYDGDLTDSRARRRSASFAATTRSSPCTRDHPDMLVAARQECPLVVGLGDGEAFVASAIPAFLAETRGVLRSRTARSSPSRGDGRP